MKKTIDPKTFNLPSRTVIEQIGNDHLALVVTRKSRVIMSDGKTLLQKAQMIKKLQPDAKVSLKISAPLCSKTKKFLEDHGIAVQTM